MGEALVGRAGVVPSKLTAAKAVGFDGVG